METEQSRKFRHGRTSLVANAAAAAAAAPRQTSRGQAKVLLSNAASHGRQPAAELLSLLVSSCAFHLPCLLIRGPVAVGAVGGAGQGPGVEAGGVGAPTAVQGRGPSTVATGAGVVLLNSHGLVRAVQSRARDVQDEGRGLDGHCGGRTAGIALGVAAKSTAGHLGRRTGGQI